MLQIFDASAMDEDLLSFSGPGDNSADENRDGEEDEEDLLDEDDDEWTDDEDDEEDDEDEEIEEWEDEDDDELAKESG